MAPTRFKICTLTPGAASLRSRYGLAIVLTAQGKHAEAESEYRSIWPLLERAWSSVSARDIPVRDLPLVSNIRYRLAQSLWAQGKYDTAEREYRALLDGPKEWNLIRMNAEKNSRRCLGSRATGWNRSRS
jgi:hypothetical protein